MKPLQHAQITAHRYGGVWHDWISFHNWIDQSKMVFASMQHRMLLHSDFGGWLAERVFGETLAASDGARARTRDLFSDHQMEDLGRIVPLSEWLKESDPSLARRCRRPPRELEPVRDCPAEGLAARWGGRAEDYRQLIAFFDKPSEFAPDFADAARLVTHSSFGIFLSEQLFGVTLTLSPNQKYTHARSARLVSTRSAAEDLVYARLGWIPSAGLLPARTRLRMWMRGTGVRTALRERLAGEKSGRQIEEQINYCSASGEGQAPIPRTRYDKYHSLHTVRSHRDH